MVNDYHLHFGGWFYWATVIRTFDVRADGTPASKTSHGVIVQKILHINRSKYLINVYVLEPYVHIS